MACLLLVRTRLGLDVLPSRLSLQARSHLSFALQSPSPASLEVETMPCPTAHPDPSVFESMSEEYTAVSTPPHHFTPLTSSEILASLVSKRNFLAADMLRKEMVAHHIPIPRDVLYLRAALHAISHRRPKGSGSLQDRLDAFEAWLSLAPDRHEEWQSFHDIRQRLFRSMDHLSLTLVYRFGLVLASKGYYSGDAAMQVVSTLARYAHPSVVQRYLHQIRGASQDYHSTKGSDPLSVSLAGAYNLSIRTVALGGKADAALALISIAHSHGIQVSDFTLNIVAKHAPDQQSLINHIMELYPSWTLQDTSDCDIPVECETIPAGQAAGITVLATRLRSLRMALRSPSPPSPHALHNFIISYRALGRTRAVHLLRTLAYRHSLKSASTWAFTEMLHHRSRREHFHLLHVFSQHFHLVGVPRKTLLSLIRGTRGQQARKEPVKRWVDAPCPMNTKIWPTAHHTALVWEAIVSISPNTDRERLYSLLLSLVGKSRRQERLGQEAGSRVQLTLPPDTYDAAHFSPFVSMWARRRPTRAASVLRDMVHVGVEPSMIQWSMVARGYAQHDDPAVALRILERLEEVERGEQREGDMSKRWSPSDVLLGVHTNVLRGFVLAGDVWHAREVERRLMSRLGYQAGDRQATDGSIALLRGLEERESVPA